MIKLCWSPAAAVRSAASCAARSCGIPRGKLLIFDIYENCAYELEMELRSKYGADAPIVTLIGSIRDKHRLDEVFETYHPSVVFHAAAHKHVPLMELSPAEAVKNNVFGTKNLLTSGGPEARC